MASSRTKPQTKTKTPLSINYELWVEEDGKRIAKICDTTPTDLHRAFNEDWFLRFREKKYTDQEIEDIIYDLKRSNRQRKAKFKLIDNT